MFESYDIAYEDTFNINISYNDGIPNETVMKLWLLNSELIKPYDPLEYIKTGVINQNFIGIPIHIWHGEKDSTLSVEFSKQFCRELVKRGFDADITVVESFGHEIAYGKNRQCTEQIISYFENQYK